MTAAQTITGNQSESAREARHRAMIGSNANGTRSGNPVQIRDGPAAVRGVAPPPKTTGREAGKAAEEGAPSQKTFRAAAQPRTPRGRRIRVSTTHRSGGVALLACALAAPALARA